MLDRTASGTTDFHHEFGNKLQYAAPESLSDTLEFSIFMDTSSMELFVNKGQCGMTAQLFPYQRYTHLEIENLSTGELGISELKICPIPSIW